MDIYDKLGVTRYINAHDTYTVYGASRISPGALRAMEEISRHFVSIEELQRALGEKIARMTHNEAAYVTNGAAGGMMLAAAVCMAGGDAYRYSRLPQALPGVPNEFILLHCQHNAYDAALEAAGGRLVKIGDADETLAFSLEGAIGEKTAAVMYFPSIRFAEASLPLEEVIRIAHAKNVPVIVDAAAQIPPPENLWNYTKMGADLVVFSGGKTLCGPQDSGLIVGRRDLIEDCVRFGAPMHGVCRVCKTSREAMAGLYVALEEYLALNQEDNTRRLQAINAEIEQCMRAGGLRTEIVPYGPVGQTYPRVFGFCAQPGRAEKLVQAMLAKHIYTGLDARQNAIYISPLNLNEEETAQVADALAACLRETAQQ